jgi:hypothetical protein
VQTSSYKYITYFFLNGGILLMYQYSLPEKI